jgi:hypothetical protein
MGLRKILMREVISPDGSAGRALRLAFEVVGLLVFLGGVVLVAPHTLAAIALLCAGTIIVIRRKTYTEFRLIQGRGAVLIGSTFLLVGGVMAAYAILNA